MGEFILFTSGKGGVGKSTLAYQTGRRIAAAGHKTLLLDADVGLKNLDLISKVAGVSPYDLYDVYHGHAEFDEALSQIGPKLDLLTLYGATTLSYLNEEVLTNVLSKLNKEYDYILIDSPAGIEKGFEMTRKVTDLFLLVVNPTLTSISDAAKVSEILRRSNQNEIGIVLNRFSHRDMAFFKTRGNVLCSYDILAVVPELATSFISRKMFDKSVKKLASNIVNRHERQTESI